MGDKDKIRLLVQVKGATNAQCVAIRKLINLYSSSKHIQYYTNEVIYTVEAPNTEAIKLLTELKPYEKAGVVYAQLDGRGKHEQG